MKFAARLKFASTGTNAADLAAGAAAPGCRTLAQCISDGDLAVSDAGIAFTIEDGAGNWETSIFTITSSTQITRTSVLRSSAGGTTPAVFTGSALVVFNDVPASHLSKIVTASVDSSGGMTGLVGPDGKVIAIGGGEQPSENTPAARAVKTIAAVTQTQLITSNSSAATGQRLACAEKNRKRIVFKNPASNTVSIQIGQTQNDNINRNGSYTTSYTIAPGEELVCWYDQNQWYARQASATAVANQSLIVESEVNV